MSQVISGQMRIAGLSDGEIRALYGGAREAGINVFDHADLYGFNAAAAAGAYHFCEQRFGKALALSASEREEVVLQSKTSIVIGREGTFYDSSAEHIVASVERSLRALRTDYLDILLLHRPDSLLEPEEVAQAFDALESAGKVRAFGVSNYTVGQIELLKTAVEQPLVVNQVQLSLVHAPLIAQGLTANIAGEPDAAVLDGGLLDYCRVRGITLQAWSPFQGGAGLIFDRDVYPDLNVLLDDLAAEYGVSPQAIALAWITRHPAGIQVVLGSTNPARVKDAAVGAGLRLSRAQWYSLYRAAGHRLP